MLRTAPPITGTDGAETLSGTTGNDSIDALNGNDTVAGLAGTTPSFWVAAMTAMVSTRRRRPEMTGSLTAPAMTS